MVSLTLDALAAPLDRSLLHVFVAGPGYGEGIAVALPHSGWIVLDGCRVSTGRLPIQAILDRWRSPTEPVEALLLTHPHTDHAFGIRDLIESTAPRRIGVTTSPTSPALVFATAEAELAAASPGSLDQLRRRTVIDAMLAIRRRFDAAPADLIALVDGAQVPLANPGIAAFVRAPDAALVHDRLAGGYRGDPNELSAVVELVFGATLIVLGSDLPTVDARGVVLNAGWDSVLRRSEHRRGCASRVWWTRSSTPADDRSVRARFPTDFTNDVGEPREWSIAPHAGEIPRKCLIASMCWQPTTRPHAMSEHAHLPVPGPGAAATRPARAEKPTRLAAPSSVTG